ncbi:MAG: metallophosphoesterase [Alicyclobacillus sp.]|nr:metallophosphoesterase [Alicyclobacillus sp.]
MQPQLRFSVMSDLHFMAWKDTLEPVEWVPALRDALQDVSALQPDFLVINGDLTNGKLRDYDLALRIISETISCPVFYTMGNHEYYGFYEDENFSCDVAQARFLQYTRQSSIYYTHEQAGAYFIFLSTERYTPDLRDAGWIGPEQLHWLNRQLDSAPTGPVFVFFHQPVNHTVANSIDTCVQSDDVRCVLKTRPGVMFFTGHTHCRMDQPSQLVQQDGVWYIGGGCVCNDLPQSRWVELYEDSILLRIRDHKQHAWITEYDTSITRPSRD